jgi:hypothetical protein
MPRAYDISLGSCTGVAFDHLNDKAVLNVQGVPTPTGVLYSANFSVALPFVATYFFDVLVGWLNTVTDARSFRFDLTVTIFPIGLPPVTTLFGQASYDYSNVEPLHDFIDAYTFQADVSFWMPITPFRVRARRWGA